MGVLPSPAANLRFYVPLTMTNPLKFRGCEGIRPNLRFQDVATTRDPLKLNLRLLGVVTTRNPLMLGQAAEP